MGVTGRDGWHTMHWSALKCGWALAALVQKKKEVFPLSDGNTRIMKKLKECLQKARQAGEEGSS